MEHSNKLCSLCILTICNISYFPFWFCRLDLGSDCFAYFLLHYRFVSFRFKAIISRADSLVKTTIGKVKLMTHSIIL